MSKKKFQKEFFINEFLSVKLVDDKIVLYVGDSPFRQCKYLLLINPPK
ncbi:MAG: hypothetical protein ACQERB_07160 [Promethearchaeati archaeon]